LGSSKKIWGPKGRLSAPETVKVTQGEFGTADCAIVERMGEREKTKRNEKEG
jgi:hypothetical protein